MRPSSLYALEQAARLTRNNQLVAAMRVAEPVILTADPVEAEEIREWLAAHAADFTGEVGD